jgi:hypothetical protein
MAVANESWASLKARKSVQAGPDGSNVKRNAPRGFELTNFRMQVAFLGTFALSCYALALVGLKISGRS